MRRIHLERIEEPQLSAQLRDGVLTCPEAPGGKPTRVVTGIDGTRLEQEWVEAVRAVGRVGEPVNFAPLTPLSRSGSVPA